jgi:hypothetical protein
MIKKILLSAGLSLAILAPSSAFAAFVCQAEYFPSPGRIKLITTASASCSGATTTYWICETTGTSSGCGIFRYQVEELVGLQSSLASAAASQKPIAVSTTSCTGGGSGCLYSVAFKP